MSELVYIGLGANLNQPAKQLDDAVAALSQLDAIQDLKVSSYYCSRPMGPQDQPDYINAVARFRTELTPLTLLKLTQAIEADQGRVRKEQRWGARTLDLDILLFGEQVINVPDLQIPHYGMKNREFVIYPLLELAPTLILPCGSPLQKLADSLEVNGLVRLQDIEVMEQHFS